MKTNTSPPIYMALQTLGWLLPWRRRLRSLAFDLATAEARERERLADGLHDDVGQLLVLLRFKLAQLDSTGQAFSGDPVMQELRALLAQATEATRRATFELRSPVLQQLGLQAALESLADRMRRLGGLHVELSGQLPAADLPAAVQAVVLRVVRELLLNVHKHAQARRVVVAQGSFDGYHHIEVQDDGVGFARALGPRRFGAEGGYGLYSAEAQVLAIGGALRVSTCPGQGTTVQLWLPASPEPASGRARRRHHRALDAA